MNPKLLKLVPKRYYCPFCGNWHEWDRKKGELAQYDSNFNLMWCYCKKIPKNAQCNIKTGFFFTNSKIFYFTETMCNRVKGYYPISSIEESMNCPQVRFTVDFTAQSRGELLDMCVKCGFINECNFRILGYTGDGPHMKITFGFEFDPDEYFEILKPEKRVFEETDNDTDNEESNDVKKEKENNIMAGKEKNNMTIKKMLYERAPKENLEQLKNWSEKYKPTLRWAIPMVAVYAAYRILNSNEFDISVNNIADVCEEKLGFKLGLLEDKKVLKELMVLGGISAGAYGAVKAVSAIFGTKTEKDDISVEEVEAGMSQLESISKKFAWIQPKMENLMPIAFSVIAVYLILHKPKFNGKIANKVQNLTEDWQVRIGAYLDLVKLFVQDKFNIDLSNEEEQKKVRIIAILALMIAIFAILYGKKVLSKKDEADQEETEDKSVETFVEQAKQIIEKVAPSLYTATISLLISKKILAAGEIPEIEDKKGKNPDDKVEDERKDESEEVEETEETDDSEEAETE